MTMAYRFSLLLAAALLAQGCGKTPDTHDNAAPGTGAAPAQAAQAALPAGSPPVLDTLSAPDVAGSWNAGTGKATIVAQPDGSFKLTNETNLVATGTLAGGKLDTPEWGTFGRVSQDRKQLVWANGSVWTR
jgi:hypothetical protein